MVAYKTERIKQHIEVVNITTVKIMHSVFLSYYTEFCYEEEKMLR